jgi:type I restriction enzyme S subunit
MVEEIEITKTKVATLSKVCTYSKGKKPARLSLQKTNKFSIPYINIKAFEKGIFDEYTDGEKCNLCDDGDLLMVWDGARAGFTGKARKGAIGSTLMKIEPKENLLKEYLFYFLLSIYRKLNTNPRGVGIPHVEPTLLWNSELALPSIDEQKNIVSKLEELFSDLDKGIEQLKTAQQQLKVYRQSVLKWAFEGKLTNENVKEGELPKGWKVLKVKDIGKIETGTTPSKANSEYYSNDYPFFKPTDLEAGINTRVANDNLSKKGIEHARFLKTNSILVTCIGATIGKTGLIRVDGACNQQINSITPNDFLIPEFVYYQVISKKFQDSIKENAAATTLPILNKSKFEKLDFIFAPFEEQKQIVQEIESRLSVADKLEETINNSLQQAEALRQSILKKAFEGKLV